AGIWAERETIQSEIPIGADRAPRRSAVPRLEHLLEPEIDVLRVCRIDTDELVVPSLNSGGVSLGELEVRARTLQLAVVGDLIPGTRRIAGVGDEYTGEDRVAGLHVGLVEQEGVLDHGVERLAVGGVRQRGAPDQLLVDR